MSKWTYLTVANLNIGDGEDWRKKPDMQHAVEQGADVILGAEFGDRANLIDWFLGRYPTWHVAEGKDHAGREVAIFYNGTLFKKSRFREWLVRIGYLGPQGAGGDHPGHKAVNSETLRFGPAGRTIRLLNMHPIPSAWSTSGPERDRRQAAWHREVGEFFTVAQRSKCITIGGGDTNATPLPLQHATPRWWLWDGTGNTFRNSNIDRCGHKSNRNIRFYHSWIIETEGSKRYNDHRMRLTQYRIRKAVWKK